MNSGAVGPQERRMGAAPVHNEPYQPIERGLRTQVPLECASPDKNWVHRKGWPVCGNCSYLSRAFSKVHADSNSLRLSDLAGWRFLIGDMNLTDSIKLLRDYAEHGDETAFRELVERYVDFVFSTAVRRVGGDASLAQDITQRVFADLALKARSLRKLGYLGGWLHRHTGFIASNMVRSEQRRQIREQEAAQMNAISESPDSLWQQLEPLLDETIEQLEPQDRQAILLRFFERCDFRAVGNALGISDDAAQKRVSRALEKLRSLLTERGVTLSVVLLSTLLAGRIIHAAPADLAAKAARLALAGAAASGGLVPILTKFSESFAFKLLLGGSAIVAALWLTCRHFSILETQQHQTDTISAAATGPASGPQISNDLANTTSRVGFGAAKVTGRVLVVNVVAADSGKPIPDVEFDYWLWVNGNVKHRKSLYATRIGVCKVPIPDHTTELSLVSERNGFADTLLDWHADRGEQIPAQYTLRVARAVPIGGTVVGPDGAPVAGAEVGFNNMPVAGSQARPQSDNFGWPFWITATTDSQGRWQINRIGKEALKTVYGGASHPDFVGTQLVAPGQQSDVLTQMLAETLVSRLGHAVVARGDVKDPDGNPVPNANVLVGQVAMSGSRTGNSHADGTFSIAGCIPGTNVITAQAKGFAAATLDVNLTDNSTPFELILRPGNILKLRAADEDGNPVPHADVWLDTFQNISMESKEPAAPQVEFQRQTDANGRLEWDEAPDGELKFTVSADGYMRGGDYKFRADGTEHVVTLQHGLTISGTVSDATTGRPIPKFRVIAGNPEYDQATRKTDVSWSTLDRYWLSFAGGVFKYTWDEPVVYDGDKDPGFVFKFEADGYAPYITRVIHASERNVQFALSLTQAPPTEVTVLSPDNEPAADIDVGLAAPGTRLSLVSGGLGHENVQSGGSLLTTDNAGHFALPPDPSIDLVVLASPSGYAQATPAELEANPVVQLVPWGRVEGTLAIAGQPAAGRIVSIGFGQEKALEISCDSKAFQTSTDAQGRFTIPIAPPGNHELTIVTLFTNRFGTGWSTRTLQAVTIPSGTDTVVAIDAAVNPGLTPAMLNALKKQSVNLR